MPQENGVPRSEETKQKLKKPKSEEHKQNISKNHAPCSGSLNSFFGHKHTQESKKRIGNRDYSNQKGINHYSAKSVQINK